MAVLIVIAILVLLIVAHEFGHFIAAKFSGVTVEEFGVGYPPRALSFGTWGGTLYSLNWVPFGGFVKLFGEDGDAATKRGSFAHAARWKQAIILVAGVAMNALLGWVLFSIAFHVGVPQPIDTVLPGETAQMIIADVVPNSPASAAGLKPGDELVDITDASGARAIDPLTPDAVVAFVRDHAGEALTLTYRDAGKELQATVHPSQGVIANEAGQPALGVALVLVANRAEGWGASLKDGFRQTLLAFQNVATSLWSLLATSVEGTPNLSQVVGPVGIVSYVGAASQSGVGAVLMLAAIISVNLTIINLIPIPALDGGRLAILAVEAVTRREAPKLAVRILNALGISLIVLLMVIVTYQDIVRLLS